MNSITQLKSAVIFFTIAVSCVLLLIVSGCKKKDNDILILPDKGNCFLVDRHGVLGINHVLPDDIYTTHTDVTVPCGSVSIGGGYTFTQAGVPWFNLSSIPSGATIVSATLVLTIEEAPATAITVEARDLTTNPLTSGDNQAIFDDSCAGNLYASFDIDSSQKFIRIPLNAQAVTDIQSALVSGAVGVGLRAPAATDSNTVDVSFANSVYLDLEYEE